MDARGCPSLLSLACAAREAASTYHGTGRRGLGHLLDPVLVEDTQHWHVKVIVVVSLRVAACTARRTSTRLSRMAAPPRAQHQKNSKATTINCQSKGTACLYDLFFFLNGLAVIASVPI